MARVEGRSRTIVILSRAMKWRESKDGAAPFVILSRAMKWRESKDQIVILSRAMKWRESKEGVEGRASG